LFQLLLDASNTELAGILSRVKLLLISAFSSFMIRRQPLAHFLLVFFSNRADQEEAQQVEAFMDTQAGPLRSRSCCGEFRLHRWWLITPYKDPWHSNLGFQAHLELYRSILLHIRSMGRFED